jgi:hypothetical protein
MYAALVHFQKRAFTLYVLISGILDLLFKLIVTGADGFLSIFVIGLIITAYGVFFTQTRSKLIQQKQNDEVQ